MEEPWQISFNVFFFRSESKGTITTKDLSETSTKKDAIDKALKTLETKNMIDEQSKFMFITKIEDDNYILYSSLTCRN